MTDDEFLILVTEVAVNMPGARAVMLGGSRARGDHRPDSDWDFAVYYRGQVDVGYFEAPGWPGTVYRPGDWGQVMYGGAVFDLGGRHFDIHYRNLDRIEGWWADAEQGRFSVHQLGFHVAGIPTYMPVRELATGRVLAGELDRPDRFPDALKESAPDYWRRRAASELGYARYWVADGNAVSLAGSLARAVLESAHAVLASRGRWALNEKRMVRAAGYEELIPIFAAIGSNREEMAASLRAVETVLGMEPTRI